MKRSLKMYSLSVVTCMALLLGSMSIPGVVNAEEGVAAIGGKSYATLEEAISAVGENETITLKKDVDTTNALKVDAGKTFTLDLNEKALTLSTTFMVNGNLTITGNGVMEKTSGYGYLIDNSGFLRVENGTFKETSKDGKEHNGTNNAALIRNLGDLMISNGNFSDDGIVIKNDDVSASEYGTLIIKNGIFTGGNWDNFATIQNSGKAYIINGSFTGGNSAVMTYSSTLTPVTTIDGGIFTQPNAARSVISSFFNNTVNGTPTTEYHINNGTFIGAYDPMHINGNINGTGTVNTTISGGVFDNSFEKGLADGFGCYEKDGKYVVTAAPTSITLSETSVRMKEGSEKQLTATIAPETTAAKVVWSSSNEQVATVKDGVVTAIKSGTATITAKAGDKTATSSITVYKPTNITPPTPPIFDGSKPVDKVTAGVTQDTIANIQKTLDSIISDITNGKTNPGISAETAANIKKALAEGKTITTAISSGNVSEGDLPKSDVTKIKAALNKNALIAQYLDIQVALQAEDQALGNITSFPNALTFTVAVPESMKVDGRTFYVVRLHDGKADKLNVVVNKDGTFSFQTDRLSLYAIVYEDKIDSITDSDQKETGKGVNTGDDTHLVLPVLTMIGSCALMGIVLILQKKKALNK